MDIAIWVIAVLLVFVCVLLSRTLSALNRIATLITAASDMNDENQRQIFSCVRRIHMVEHMLKGIRSKGVTDVEEKVHILDGDRSKEESIRDEFISR
ncbi:hypothetical protein [Pseudomonas sp. DSP3-2-2]|uniref:hypothetical protein n=1 Tax=unclassified Pseudomonas TaxID=196821 RepID=UPI003CE7BC0D